MFKIIFHLLITTLIYLNAAASMNVTMVQTGGANPVTVAGQVISYTIVVENAGTLNLTDISVTLIYPGGMVGILNAPVESTTADNILELGETWTYTANYTVTQFDIDEGLNLVSMVSVVSADISYSVEDNSTTPVVSDPNTVVDLNNGLVAHYEFEGNANDSSGNGNHGTWHGTESANGSYTAGVIGQAGSFDGVDDYIEVQTSTSLQTNTRMAISLWVNYSSIPTNYQNNKIVSLSENFSPYGGYWIDVIPDDGLYQPEIMNVRFVTSSETPNHSYVTDKKLNLNVWEHIIVIFENQTRIVYVNGVKANDSNLDFSTERADGDIIFSSSNPLLIGKWYPSMDTLHASVDDLRIYNRALTETEIQELYNLGNIEQTSVIPVISSLDIPYHTEIQPKDFSVYINAITDFDASQLFVTMDGASMNVLSTETHTDGSIRIDLPFNLSSNHTVTLQYGESTADIAVNAHAVPFRVVDDYWAFEYIGLGKAGFAVGIDVKIGGVDFEAGAGISGRLEGGLAANGSANQLIANSRTTGDFLYGIPFSGRIEGAVEASAFKLKLKDPIGEVVNIETNVLSGEAHIVARRKTITYPTKINYPTQNHLLASYIVPQVLASLPINISGIGATAAYDFSNATPYKEIELMELELNGNLQFYNVAVSSAGLGGSMEISLPYIKTTLSFPQLEAMKKWVWVKGSENGKAIDLFREQYRGGITPLELNIADVWKFQAGGTSSLSYFERGIDNDRYIARMRLDLGAETLYDDLENGAKYTMNEITYHLDGSDYLALKDDFSIQNFTEHSFYSPTPIESWLLTDDGGYKLGLLKIEAQALVGFGIGVNLLSNMHERALAGVGYKLGNTVYPIYHNVLNKTDDIAFKTVDMREMRASDILLQSLKESADDLKNEIKQRILGLAQVMTEVVVDVANDVKEVYVETTKIAKHGTKQFINNFKTGWKYLEIIVDDNLKTSNLSQKTTDTDTQTAVINNANLFFVSDLLEITTEEGTSPSEVIIFPIYGTLDDTGVYRFVDNRWELIAQTSIKEDGLAFIPEVNGYYALIKHFADSTELYTNDTVGIDTMGVSSLLSNPQYLSDGSVAAYTDFNISITSAYTTINGVPEFNVIPFTYSQVLQTNTQGVLDLNLSTGENEGFANVSIRPVSGYGSDELLVYVTDPSGLKPIEDFDFNITLPNTQLFVGDYIDVNISVIVDSYSDFVVTIVAPDGTVSDTLPMIADQGGVWRIVTNATDENGYVHTKSTDVRVTYECTYFVNTESSSHDANGGEGNITIGSSPLACEGGSWNATESSDWISLDGNVMGSGEGSWLMTYTVSKNYGDERSADIEIGDINQTIIQEGGDIVLAPIIMYLLN